MSVTAMTSIVDLAKIIVENTSKVDQYIREKNLPQPSFDINGPVKPVADAPSKIQAARDAAAEACLELQQLLNGADSLIFPDVCLAIVEIVNTNDFQSNFTSLQAIYRFRIATKFPVGAEISFLELANACGLYEHDLRRIIRYAIVHHRCFIEPRKGVVAHSAVSRRIAECPFIQDIMGLTYEECYPAHAKAVDALSTFQKSQEPNATGYALANNTTDPIFTFLGAHPDRARRFAGAMSSTSKSGLALLAQSYPWETTNLVVDVGGSQGHVSAYLAEKFINTHFVVQDLQEVVREQTYKIPSKVADRVELMAHDFFTEQPVKNADVYFIRYILHNWSDDYSKKILRNIIPVMKPGSKIVIQDHVLQDPGTVSPANERHMR